MDAHHAQVITDPDGTPAGVTNVDRFLFDAHHLGDAGAADVGVHYSDHGVRVGGEGVRKHRCEGRFPDAAFSREDKDFVLYVGKAGGYDRDVGVGTFWGGSADGLVGAAGAGIRFAGLIGLRPRTMFWGDTVSLIETLRWVRGRSGGLPGSGATSFGAAFKGALKSTWMGSSSDGAIVWYSAVRRHWYVARWFTAQERQTLIFAYKYG